MSFALEDISYAKLMQLVKKKKKKHIYFQHFPTTQHGAWHIINFQGQYELDKNKETLINITILKLASLLLC